MKKFHFDVETRATVDIKRVGAWAYARHPQTEILCAAYAFDGEKPKVLTAQLIKDGAFPVIPLDTWIVSHSAHFEWAIAWYILHKQMGYPAFDKHTWSCTLARAALCGLPLSLENAGAALNLPVQKDVKGRQVMLKLCKPVDVDPLSGDPVYLNDPELFQKLYDYCARDVETEMLLDKSLPELPPQERAIFELDLLVNHRGIQTDVEMARKAADLARVLTEDLNTKLHRLTGGAVSAASRVAEMKRYLSTHGIEAESLDKTAVTALLADEETPQKVRDVLAIRRQVGKSSTAKYTAVLNCADPEDGRVRGALQYHAAHTGRWGGRLIQIQNFPQGIANPQEQENVVDFIKAGDPEIFSFIYGDGAMETLSKALRGVVTAAPNHELVAADYSAIEARVLFWLAGDYPALECYRRGDSPYVDLARFIFKNDAITKKTHPKEYDLGKRAILGCGYGMGAPKFQATCKIQANLDIELDLALRAVKAYRDKYRSVVSLWYSTEAAAKNAVRDPGKVFYCGSRNMIAWGMSADRRFLVCKLPSGRHLRYYRPSLKAVEGPYGEKEELRYWVAGINGALEETHTYGGALVENVVQAVARDLMCNGMLKAEAAGYPVVFSVHDEVVAERRRGEGSVEEYVKLLCDLPSWAAGCPIAAEGWRGSRYRK